MRILRLFQYQDRTFRHGQLTGKKKSYRAGPGDDDVVSGLMLIVAQQEAPETFMERHSIIME